MNTQEKATPTPWEATKFSDTKSTSLYADGGTASLGSIKKAEDAELIVKAVNGWNDVQALRARLHELETIVHDGITEDPPEVSK